MRIACPRLSDTAHNVMPARLRARVIIKPGTANDFLVVVSQKQKNINNKSMDLGQKYPGGAA